MHVPVNERQRLFGPARVLPPRTGIRDASAPPSLTATSMVGQSPWPYAQVALIHAAGLQGSPYTSQCPISHISGSPGMFVYSNDSNYSVMKINLARWVGKSQCQPNMMRRPMR